MIKKTAVGACAISLLATLGGLAATTTAEASSNTRLILPASSRLLIAHNQERAMWRVPPLQWDPALAAAADSYASYMARTNTWGHSDRRSRGNTGENLWMGTRGAFSHEQMVGGWLSERRMFRPGVFPRVSRNGNWAEVGHYTQLIWRTTTRVGCAVRSSRHHDYLVCRYWPAGNVDGRPVA